MDGMGYINVCVYNPVDSRFEVTILFLSRFWCLVTEPSPPKKKATKNFWEKENYLQTCLGKRKIWYVTVVSQIIAYVFRFFACLRFGKIRSRAGARRLISYESASTCFQHPPTTLHGTAMPMSLWRDSFQLVDSGQLVCSWWFALYPGPRHLSILSGFLQEAIKNRGRIHPHHGIIRHLSHIFNLYTHCPHS